MSSDPAVSLSPAAAEAVRAHQRELGQEGCLLRVGVVGGGCSGLSYALAYTRAPGDDDVVVDASGVSVAVDRRSLRYLAGATLGYEAGPRGGKFSLDAPLTRRRCSCGVSFAP